MLTPPPRRQPATSNRAQVNRPAGRPPAQGRPVSGRVAVARQNQPAPAPRPVSQRPRAVAAPTPGQRVLRAGVGAAKTYVEYNQGVLEGLVGSVKSTWGFVTKDAWQVKTWTEMGTTMVAVSLMSPQHTGTAQWLDGKLGTQFGQRQVQIVMALDQTFKEMPHWKARQWGQLVGRVAGDVLTTKGAGSAVKMGARGTSALNRMAATRYLARNPQYAAAFSDVKGFNLGMGQRSYKVQEALEWARKGRWLSDQKLPSSSETVLKMALDYPGSRNQASIRWSVRRFGVYVEGTVAPQANPLGGGGHQLLRVIGKEGGYVEVPYK